MIGTLPLPKEHLTTWTQAQKIEARETPGLDVCIKAIPDSLVAIATTAATATTAITTTATAARAFFARLGHVNSEGAAIHFLAVQGLDGFVGFLGGPHGDKTKTARTAGFPVHHQVGFGDRAMLGERVIQVVFGGIEGKVSHIQFIAHMMLYGPTNRHFLQTVPERRV